MIGETYQYIFPGNQYLFWKQILNLIEQISEIRIRVNMPIRIYWKAREISLDEEGNILYASEEGKVFSYEEIQELINGTEKVINTY